jgi:hypothetical protein
MQALKYTSTFASSPIKCLVGKEKDELLSIASLSNLRDFIPNIDVESNSDLLPVSFTVATVNRINKNDDLITTATALSIYKNFINKFIDLEHKRHACIGVILTSNFSEFGTEKLLTEDQVKNLTTPFNITLGGVIWKIANPEIAELIEEANDPSSSDYMSIASSWELLFDSFDILVLDKGQKNSSFGKTISNQDEVEKISKSLRSNGGTGNLGEQRIYRMPSGRVIPLGVGLTEKPAADVKGVAVGILEETKETDASLNGSPAYDFYFCPKCQKDIPKGSKSLVINPYGHVQCQECGTSNPTAKWTHKPSKTNPVLKDDASVKAGKDKILDINEKNISQSTISNVKIERKQILMFKSLKDITDENLKTAMASETAVASQIADIVSSEIKKGNDVWVAEKSALTNQKLDVETKLADASAKQLVTENALSEMKKTVASLEKDKADREAVEKFNVRMGQATDAYDFDVEQTEVIASEIKSIKSDEEFTQWEAKAKKLFKPFKKGAKKDDKKADDAKDDKGDDNDADADGKKKDAKASEAKASVVDNAIDNAKKDGAVANSATAQAPTLMEKYKEAFAMENFIVNKR